MMARLRLLLALAVVCVLVVPLTPTSPTASAEESTAASDGFSMTKTLTRVHVRPDGTEQPIAENTVTVTANQTTELRGRERVRIEWSGARPSGGRASDPYGERGLSQEYPVVVLQCRGVDSASAPAAAERITPETCWTATSLQRSVVTPHRTAVWRHDVHEPEADRAERSGPDPFPAEECQVPSPALFSARITPFRAADGRVFLGCNAENMPPEAAIGASFLPAETAAFTGEDGTGEIDFEVRSEVENESLGCSRTVKCAIVVIPIMGISCADQDVECRRNGTFLQGSSNFAGADPHAAVSPRFWWSESNWRNRFTIPIEFGSPPDTCEVLDPRPPVGFFGSELMSQAALQWSPAYCLNEDRFKFQHNSMPDDAAFSLMSSGNAVAALVSGPQEQRGTDPVGYAPTAVTGFGIGYVVDRPDNAGEYDRLRLNARLIAKLLTQSYPASELGRQHPGLEDNPLTINRDPEFKALNPGLDETDREAAATIMSLSTSSDVMGALTAYLAADKDARAFIKGQADPWGMTVNPTYRDIEVPRREWPLLDTYKPPAQPGTCRASNNDVPYLSQIAAPVSSLRIVSDALIDGWPHVQTTCDGPLAGGLFRTGRVARQPYGQRFLIGIVSLGDAARFGLRSAALETASDTFARPTEDGLSRAVALARQPEPLGPFTLDQTALRRDPRAYPGTMVVYTAARLRNLPRPDARTVASFVDIATTEGQVRGRANGQLPAGFLPLRKAGVTSDLFRASQEVADAIRAQAPPISDPPADPDPSEAPDDGTTPDAPGGASTPPGTVDTGGVSEPPAGGATPPEEAPEAVPPAGVPPVGDIAMPETQAVSSGVAGGLLPMLVLLAGLALVLTTASRVVVPLWRSRR